MHLQKSVQLLGCISAAEAGEYIRRGDVLLSLGEFGRAEEAYLRAVELEPADWRGWFGMVKTRTKNFTESPSAPLSRICKKYFS